MSLQKSLAGLYNPLKELIAYNSGARIISIGMIIWWQFGKIRSILVVFFSSYMVKILKVRERNNSAGVFFPFSLLSFDSTYACQTNKNDSYFLALTGKHFLLLWKYCSGPIYIFLLKFINFWKIKTRFMKKQDSIWIKPSRGSAWTHQLHIHMCFKCVSLKSEEEKHFDWDP